MTTYEKSDTVWVWTLFQYISPSGRGAIDDWRNSLPVGSPRADLDTFLRDMVKKDKWEPPDIAALQGKPYQGLTELRWKSGRVPHRIFGYELQLHKYVMIIGCTHKDTYDPPSAFDTLLTRRKQIENNEASYDEYRLILGR